MSGWRFTEGNRFRRQPKQGHEGLERRCREDGSITAFVALVLVALFALLGLVVDGGRAISSQQAAVVEAEQAARAGAGALSVGGLRHGTVTLVSRRAIADAVAYTVAAGHPGTATMANGVVTVHVRYRMPTVILGIVGISSLPVSATATAVDLAGVTQGAP